MSEHGGGLWRGAATFLLLMSPPAGRSATSTTPVLAPSEETTILYTDVRGANDETGTSIDPDAIFHTTASFRSSVINIKLDSTGVDWPAKTSVDDPIRLAAGVHEIQFHWSAYTIRTTEIERTVGHVDHFTGTRWIKIKYKTTIDYHELSRPGILRVDLHAGEGYKLQGDFNEAISTGEVRLCVESTRDKSKHWCEVVPVTTTSRIERFIQR